MSSYSVFQRRKKANQGFTLLEVMLAMAVFAIAGISLLAVSDNNYRHISHLEEKMFANWVASNQLVNATLAKNWPPKNNKKGEEELAGRKWYWQQKVIKTANNDMKAIVMEVRLDQDEALAITSLMTYIAKDKP
jgi:general secretion pathway protein I